MHRKKFKSTVLFVFSLLFILSCIDPIYPREMYLQHLATLLAGIFLVTVAWKNALSDRSFLLIVLFMVFHIIGARWIYSYVPYNDWIKFLTGINIDDTFHFSRNHYDRLVHFLFGLLMIIPFAEIFHRWFTCPKKLSFFVAWIMILAMGSIYEVFEWSLSVVLSPEDAEAYNGQQGDFWDSQKDVALAMLGGLITMNLQSIVSKIKRNSSTGSM